MEYLTFEVGEAHTHLVSGFLDVTHGIGAARHAEGFATSVDGAPQGGTILAIHLTDFPAARTP